jgi:hypothetical protein
MAVTCVWRGDFDSLEANALHSEAFETQLFNEAEWEWKALVPEHSLGWVVARDDDGLVGFVNVVWDGLVHAWIQDAMVAIRARGRGVWNRAGDRRTNGRTRRRVRVAPRRLRRAAPAVLLRRLRIHAYLGGPDPPPVVRLAVSRMPAQAT